MTSPKDHLISWLRDAHAAEEQAVTMLSSMADRLEHYPELRSRIEQHVEETERQAEMVRQCLQSLGSDASTLKDMGTKMLGLGQGLSGMFTDDEVVKGVLASYALEHMEIASYRILVVAAQEAGEPDTQRVCETILSEEIAMAEWLEDHMSSITSSFLARAGDDATARR